MVEFIDLYGILKINSDRTLSDETELLDNSNGVLDCKFPIDKEIKIIGSLFGLSIYITHLKFVIARLFPAVKSSFYC